MSGTFSSVETLEILGLASAPAVSAAGRTRLYYNTASNRLEASVNAAAFVPVIAPGWPQAYALPIAGFEPSVSGPALVGRNFHQVVGLAKGESVLLKGRLPLIYDASKNLEVRVNGIAENATSGDVDIGLEFDSLNAQDFDADTFAAQVTAVATASATSGVIFTCTYSLAAASLDSTPAGGLFRLRLTYRNVAGSTMLNDWQGVDVVMFQ